MCVYVCVYLEGWRVLAYKSGSPRAGGGVMCPPPLPLPLPLPPRSIRADDDDDDDEDEVWSGFAVIKTEILGSESVNEKN